MKVRKAVIPAAGLGTRFLPATKTTPKEMLPIVDKPSIQYVVEEAAKAGIEDILIISGRSKKTMEDHFDRAPELEAELTAKGKVELLALANAPGEIANVHFVRQGLPLGLGHAVNMARHHIGDEPFAVLLPDDLIHHRVPLLVDMIATYERTGASVVALMEVDDPSAYGCAAVEAEGDLVRITAIVEKPAPGEAPSNLAVMGRYVFTPEIFAAMDEVTPGKGGELQLTDGIALLIERSRVYGQVFSEGRYDAGNKLDYLRAVVEFALEHHELGPDFAAWLKGYVATLP